MDALTTPDATGPAPRVTLSPYARMVMFVVAAQLMSWGTASAQSSLRVRIAEDDTTIRMNQRANSAVVMTAARGAVFDVIHTEGDRFAHRRDNWYWVLLPRDAWGTQRAGWISGRHVDEVSRSAERSPMMPGRVDPPATEAVVISHTRPRGLADAVSAVEKPAPADARALDEVVLHFEFAKSDLTDDASRTLGEAVAQLTGNAQLSFAVEGHADAVGSEAFNRDLGLARAEAVKRHLAERLHVPADQIGVISYGESQPAAPNSTDEGRAQNRRVVIRVGR